MKPRKVYVSDVSVEVALSGKRERWLVGEGFDHYWCLDGPSASIFENTGNITKTVKWDFIAEIPEKKTRLMATEECVIWSATEGYKDWAVKLNGEGMEHPSNFTYYSPEKYSRAKVIDGKIGEWQKFEVEE
jgi:hypothetical protein